jgi:outer membrane lipoprotein-sorting protein
MASARHPVIGARRASWAGARRARSRGRAATWCALLALAGAAARPAAASGAAAQPGAGSSVAGAMLLLADQALRPIAEGSIRIRSTVERSGEETVGSEIEVLVQGGDHALCIFRAGPLAGRRILMVGDRVWLLVPGTTRPIPVSASQRLLGGASIGDVARLRFAPEFTATLRAGEETVDGFPCRVLDLVARGTAASYGGGTLWVDSRDGRPRRARFTLPSGKEAKEVRYAGYTTDGGRPVLTRLEIEHRLPSERGMRTTLEFIDHETRTLDPGTFDPGRARDVP